MTPPSDKVRSHTPTWSKLVYEAHPAFGVGGRVGPRLEDWAHEGSCVDQCDNEVWHVGVPAGVGHLRQAMVEPQAREQKAREQGAKTVVCPPHSRLNCVHT
jgi:hypothetical protein